MNQFHHAITCLPSQNFAQGLTTSHLGAPDYSLALFQHHKYCLALERCGLKVITLEADERYPDSTFIEDTAIVTPRCAILTNPGANSRKGEVVNINKALSGFYKNIYTISAPGTVDGGDICEAEGHFFIGISRRTNQEGGRQLAGFLTREGYSTSFIDVKGIASILHLKSGIAYLGNNNMVLIDAFIGYEDFKPYHIIGVEEQENYAANCLWVNDYVLLPEGYPLLTNLLTGMGYQVITLEMSEYQKMDGGLSCLSLRI